MTTDEVRALLGRIVHTYGRRVRLTDELVGEWHRALLATSAAQGATALDRWAAVTDGSKAPNLAQLLGCVRAVQHTAEDAERTAVDDVPFAVYAERGRAAIARIFAEHPSWERRAS